MAVSMREIDPAFQGSGQKPGLEIWRIENFCPVTVPTSYHGKFYTGDSYLILKTTLLKNGALHHDIHYWLGKDCSQDEAGTSAIKAVELDAALGGRAVQYREIQGHETDKFLSYFKPCIIPQKGGVASGFRHTEVNMKEHATRLFSCKGKHEVHVEEVPFARSSINHDGIFILDAKSKIFQFNGSNSTIQERAKALEVVQYIKNTYHDGKCDVAVVEDEKLMADADAGEFWTFFGGFAPLQRKTAPEGDRKTNFFPKKLLRIEKGQAVPIEAESLTKALLDTYKCYLLDCGNEIFVWIGRNTSLEQRKSASSEAEELLHRSDRHKASVTRTIEGFETVAFLSKFDIWPHTTEGPVSDESRAKVTAILKWKGLNLRSIAKSTPIKEEPHPYIDCTGNLQVWRVNGKEEILLSSTEHLKFYGGDCYVFRYAYPSEDREECLVGTWFGKKSIQEERISAILISEKMVDALKSQSVQARMHEGKEPIQFLAIFQCFIVLKGGKSSGYKRFIIENNVQDETYDGDSLALFRVQGYGPENMQAIQVEPVASSLNSSYCYILHCGSTVFMWYGSLTTPIDQELVERQLDFLKPNVQSKIQKEGSESDLFWNLLGGKCEYPSQKVRDEPESDPHLFCCNLIKGNLKVHEAFNFRQDDLMSEDIFILDCHSVLFVWVGQQVDPKSKKQALNIGEKFLECDPLLENISPETPIYIVFEGNEPPFFTRFFSWDSAKATMHGNSFQRRLAVVKNVIRPTFDKPKRRIPMSYNGRSSIPEKPQQRARSMSFSPDRVRVRGRSPAFNVLAAAFENPNAKNLSTPPPFVRKLYPKSITPESIKLAPRSSSIVALSASFEQVKDNKVASSVNTIAKPVKDNPTQPPPANAKESRASISSRIESLTIKEGVKESEAEDEGLPIFPYERLEVSSTNAATNIDVTKRETYLSAVEFKEKFGMTKEAFYKLPKWRQNKQKIALHLF